MSKYVAPAHHVHEVEVETDARVADVVEERPDVLGSVEERRSPRLDRVDGAFELEAVDDPQDDLAERAPPLGRQHRQVRREHRVRGVARADEGDDAAASHQLRLPQERADALDPCRTPVGVCGHEVLPHAGLADHEARAPGALARTRRTRRRASRRGGSARGSPRARDGRAARTAPRDRPHARPSSSPRASRLPTSITTSGIRVELGDIDDEPSPSTRLGERTLALEIAPACTTASPPGPRDPQPQVGRRVPRVSVVGS